MEQHSNAPSQGRATYGPRRDFKRPADSFRSYMIMWPKATFCRNPCIASLNKSKFANLRKMAMNLLVLFGSTYICEQTFSTMNINKTKLRSNLFRNPARQVLHFLISGPPTEEVARPCSK
ncbi:uncharacterized protein LOC143458902 [Clavelina lepadiformis]|uniref:uncharacterized protein LOC143458902 n=1 Tax=Clavelina lepadiformis TaxID=159417 RepID=UPI00404333D7